MVYKIVRKKNFDVAKSNMTKLKANKMSKDMS